MEEGIEQPNSEPEVEVKVKAFVDMLQESNTTSAKFAEIDKFMSFVLSRKQFVMSATQLDYMLEGNEDENVLGLCQYAGREKYLGKTVKRSSISALTLIYKLMAESSKC
jgi:hypothetical protein